MAADPPMSDPAEAEDPARDSRNRASSRRARDEREGVNSIRPRRVRERTSEDPRAGAPSGAKKERDSRSDRESAAPAAGAAKPPGASASATANLWALPQSVRDRFIQDKRRFYFPDGAPAFRDHGRRLSTGSENTEVISSLIEIARTRGWEEIRVAGTKKFRQEAWRQGRLAGLEVRGYKPTEPERTTVVRALRRQGQGAQMELGVAENDPESAAAVRESAAPSGASNAHGTRATRGLLIGKLLDHGRESYRFDPHESMSYFLEIGTAEGKRTIWGKDLERAMKQSLTQPQIGDEIGIRATGADRVTVKRRARDAEGRIVEEREIATRRNHWVVEKREFFESRAAAAQVLRDPNIDRRRAVSQHPELVGTYLQLHAAQLTARRIRDPQDRERFIAIVRGALADSVARGDPLQPVRLRDRAGRVPERKPPEREPGPARA
jgi:Large polyvalent protein-associated domain 7